MNDAIISRFEKYIDKSGECWLWTGCCYKNGYGRFNLNGKNCRSHRLAYLLANGELPQAPLVIRHKCRSRNCCNPDHLESGTVSENHMDKLRDGTDNRGEKCNTARLTEAQVKEIRRRHAERPIDIAKEFQVSRGCIQGIIHKKTWAWLE